MDIHENRRASKYGPHEQLKRLLWMVGAAFFRFSPRTCFGYRRWLLRWFGAKIGANTNIYQSATIYMPWNLEVGEWSSIGEHAYIYNLGKVSIGNNVTVSYRAHICAGTHDYSDAAFALLKPSVHIADDVWICTDAFVGPGVRVGAGAVVAARAVAVQEVRAWTVVAGNPAQEKKRRIVVTRATPNNDALQQATLEREK
jgi:putative colanic acid biosynthesis acetyltransferase WcaF